MRRSRISTLALAALVAAPASALAQGSFEGAVTYTITSHNASPTMVYYVKGNKARMESTFNGHTSVMLFDGASSKMVMIMPEQKMYMTVGNMDDMQPKDAKIPKLTRTGRTEMIAGHACEDWEVQQEGQKGTTTMCIAKGMGDFMFARSRMERSHNALSALLSNPQFREVIKGGFFPLKIVSMSPDDSMTWVATKIESHALSDLLFTVPAGYREFSMPNMRPPGH